MLKILRRVLGIKTEEPSPAPGANASKLDQRKFDQRKLDQRQLDIARRLAGAGVDGEVVQRTLEMHERAREHPRPR